MPSRTEALRDYNEVSQRVEGFNERYPNGRIVTDIVELTDSRVTVRAAVFKDKPSSVPQEPDGVGHSYLAIPGSTNFTRGSELENAETSAVGRALAFIGFYAKGESLASKQEIAAKGGESKRETKTEDNPKTGLTKPQTAKLMASIKDKAPSIASDSDKRRAFVSMVTAANGGVGKQSTKQMTNDDLDAVLNALDHITESPYSDLLEMAEMVESTKETTDE